MEQWCLAKGDDKETREKKYDALGTVLTGVEFGDLKACKLLLFECSNLIGKLEKPSEASGHYENLMEMKTKITNIKLSESTDDNLPFVDDSPWAELLKRKRAFRNKLLREMRKLEN